MGVLFIDIKLVLVFLAAKALAHCCRMCYIKGIKGAAPFTRGWPIKINKIAMPPIYRSKYQGGFCYV
ncbi:hypothetical protein D7V82_05465 [bacterium 1xD8-6]|nr:hypothetical protein D7V72_06145 [bacterium D16-36]RKI71638.1 hypothetical protein D7V82_05465 [bacterium 1xD8-6]